MTIFFLLVLLFLDVLLLRDKIVPIFTPEVREQTVSYHSLLYTGMPAQLRGTPTFGDIRASFKACCYEAPPALDGADNGTAIARNATLPGSEKKIHDVFKICLIRAKVQ